MKKKEHKFLYYFLAFIFTFLGHIFLNFTILHCAALPTEALSRTVAYHVINNDISTILANSNYYGTGFYVLFTPLFLLTNNGFLVRQIILLVLCIIVSLQSVISYEVITNYLKFDKKFVAILITFIISYLPVVHSNVSINEPPLEMIFWLVLYLSLINMKTESVVRRIINTVLIVFLLCWAQTIHERAIVFIISYSICYLFVIIAFRKKMLNLIAAVISLIPFAFMYLAYTKWVKDSLWAKTNITNTSGARIGIAQKLVSQYLFSEGGIAAFFKTVFSQIFTANVYTCGLFVVAFISLLCYIIVIVRKLAKKEIISVEEENKTLIILLYGMASVATILYMGASSLKTVILATQSETGTRVYAFLRYFFVFVPPLLMLTLMDLYKQNVSRRIVLISFAVSAALAKYVYFDIFKSPLENNPGFQLDRFHYFSAFSLRKAEEPLTSLHFLYVSLVLMFCYVLYLILMNGKKAKLVLLIVLGSLLIYEYMYMNFNNIKSSSDSFYASMDSYDENIYGNDEIRNSIKALYVPNTTTCYVLISEHLDLGVINEMPESLGSGEVLLNSGLCPRDTDIAYFVILDQNEYLYFSDEVLKELLSEKGFNVMDINVTDEPEFWNMYYELLNY